jgi:hypothetical protein
MRAITLIVAMCVCISAEVVTCGREANAQAPHADFTFRNIDDTYALVESAVEAEVGMTSKYTGKTVKIMNCWFNPLDESFVHREGNQEGVYIVNFYQGDSSGSRARISEATALSTRGETKLIFTLIQGSRCNNLRTNGSLLGSCLSERAVSGATSRK